MKVIELLRGRALSEDDLTTNTSVMPTSVYQQRPFPGREVTILPTRGLGGPGPDPMTAYTGLAPATPQMPAGRVLGGMQTGTPSTVGIGRPTGMPQPIKTE